MSVADLHLIQCLLLDYIQNFQVTIALDTGSKADAFKLHDAGADIN